MEQAVEGVISGRKVRIRSAYKRVRRKLRQHNLSNGTKYKYPTYESFRKRVNKKTPFERLVAKRRASREKRIPSDGKESINLSRARAGENRFICRCTAAS